MRAGEANSELKRLMRHCTVVLQSMAKFHALSMAISRSGGMSLSEVFPFAVEADGVKQEFMRVTGAVRDAVFDYARWEYPDVEHQQKLNLVKAALEGQLENLFWQLLDFRSRPLRKEREVLIHGRLDFDSAMFR